ncbi:MAG TPA: hypothetical protein VGF34_11250 [Stellaceae bacterium]|jgi:hypothetical protein
MRIPIPLAIGAALAMALGLASASTDAKMPIDMPGGDAFETKLDQQIEDANAEARRELANDPALAQSEAAAAAAADSTAPDPAPREVVTIDKDVTGVPGDEKFEAALNAWIERQNEELNSELARDPTGMGKLR